MKLWNLFRKGDNILTIGVYICWNAYVDETYGHFMKKILGRYHFPNHYWLHSIIRVLLQHLCIVGIFNLPKIFSSLGVNVTSSAQNSSQPVNNLNKRGQFCLNACSWSLPNSIDHRLIGLSAFWLTENTSGFDISSYLFTSAEDSLIMSGLKISSDVIK